MEWFDGNSIDIKDYMGESLTEKIALEMWEHDLEDYLQLPEFIRTACLIIAFDTEANMEGFFTPLDENNISPYYSEIIQAFRTIGDDTDADVLTEAYRLALHYKELMDRSEDEESEKIYDEAAEKIGKLGDRSYLYTDFDIWELLYKYLDK